MELVGKVFMDAQFTHTLHGVGNKIGLVHIFYGLNLPE